MHLSAGALQQALPLTELPWQLCWQWHRCRKALGQTRFPLCDRHCGLQLHTAPLVLPSQGHLFECLRLFNTFSPIEVPPTCR